MPGLSVVSICGLGSAQRNISGVLAPNVPIFNGPPMQASICVLETTAGCGGLMHKKTFQVTRFRRDTAIADSWQY